MTLAVGIAVATGFFISILAVGLAYRNRARQRRQFRHGVAAVGRYLPGGQVEASSLGAPQGREWTLPPVEAGRTAVVLFRGAARGRQPSIELRGAAERWEYPLPRAWAGHWAIDTPPAINPATLVVRHMHLAEPPLFAVCSERPAPAETCLILAPHPDDAELGAFGFYASRPEQSWIVTMTAGERGAGWAAGESADVTAGRARKRARESIEVPGLGGVPSARCRNLFLPDGRLSDLLVRPDEARDSPYRRTELAAEFGLALGEKVTGEQWFAALERLVHQLRPALIICPDPSLDHHPDHRATALALARALARNSSSVVRAVYLYTIHARYSDLAPFGSTNTPSHPPPLLDDMPLEAFFSQPLNASLRARKERALAACSDADPPVVLDRLPRFQRLRHRMWPPANPTLLVRRFVRSTEWFRVITPDTFVRTCLSQPSPS